MSTAVLPCEQLKILGLPVALWDSHVHAIFSQYGTVEHVKLLDAAPGMPTYRDAIVQMSTIEEASWLVQTLHSNIPQGIETPVSVHFLELSAPAPPAPNAPPAVPAPGMTAGAQSQPVGGAFQMGVQMRGVVKRWDDVKGFGFIVPDGGGPDVFVHTKELNDGDKLVNGTQVIFEAMQDATKGPGRFRAKMCRGAVQKDTFQVQTPRTANAKVFMTGLPLDASEGLISQIFSQYGIVISVKKMPTQAGKVDAAALVLMQTVQQAEWMVANLNKNIPTGLTQPVSIKFAENKDQSAGRSSLQLNLAVAAHQASFGKVATTAGFSLGPY